MDAVPEDTKHDHSDNLQCAYCNAAMPSYALFCGACGESLDSDSRISPGLLWSWQIIIILSAIATALFTLVFPETPLRPIVVLWFLFICPGMMLVRFLRLNEPVVEWVLALALSLAIDAIVSAIVLYAGKWSPAAILSIIIGLSLTGAITQLAISTYTVITHLR